MHSAFVCQSGYAVGSIPTCSSAFVCTTSGFVAATRARPCNELRIVMTSGSSTEPTSAQKIEYGCIQHVGMLVEDTETAKRFYMDILGMSDDHALRNPKLPFGGTFVRAGNSQVHLMELPSVDPKDGRPTHGGRDKHAAITIKSLEPLIESLDRNGVTYTFSKSGRRAVFLRDIDMNALEFVEDPDV